MKIEYGSKYKHSFKKLKNRHNEQDVLDRIINHMKRCIDFNDFKNNPISMMYGFEALRYEFNGYYSCNLNKNGGKIRSIFSTNELDIIILEFISTDHYKDFKNKL